MAVKNEGLNLPKCLQSLQPAERVVVLDSGSIDETPALAKRLGAEVIQFHYKGGYPKKRQWALNHLKIKTKWVLLIDADEEVPDDLWAEIDREIGSSSPNKAYLIKKQYHFMGKKFRFGGFSFEAILLFQKGCARFEHLIDEPASAMDMEVHERLIVEGPIGKMKTPLLHNDFKNLEAFVGRTINTPLGKRRSGRVSGKRANMAKLQSSPVFLEIPRNAAGSRKNSFKMFFLSPLSGFFITIFFIWGFWKASGGGLPASLRPNTSSRSGLK